jgi:7,8-dihydropterin-6-yl-methyl-4-(beta-D-ribofuranosyl)aminobenzene 5'-phosphate synthase
MRIVSLVDNVSNNKKLGCEHGLSLYVETVKHKLLFDLGASSLFAENALALGVDLKAIDTVVLSHGHYDHGGGLKTFLNVNDKAVIYIEKDAFGDYYSERVSGTEYIGLDQSLSQNSRIVFVDNDMILDDELKLFSSVNIVDERFSPNKKLKVRIGTEYIEDDFAHEQNLIINSDGVKVLIAGCAHNGITNIIRKFVEMEGADPNYVVSGFHLWNPSSGKNENETVIYRVGNSLNKHNTKYYTCHCTGIEPYKKLKEILNNIVEYFAAGDMQNLKKRSTK